MRIFRAWTWRFYFMIGLLMAIMFMVLLASQIINHGCHNFNTATQLVIILDFVFTAIAYACMNQKEEDKDAKPAQSAKERPKIK